MQRTLTSGPITSSILLFALPLMFGNLLQQMYNIADTWVVGRFLGADALAAVPHDLPHLDFAGTVHGQRRGHLDAVWQRRIRKNAPERVPVLYPYRGDRAGAEPAGLSGTGRHPLGAAGARRAEASDEGLPPHHLPRHHGHLPLQLLRKPSPRHRQLGGAAGLSGCVGHPERLPRPVLRHRPRLGHQGGGRRDGIFTVRIGRRHRRLYPEKFPGALPPSGRLPLG